MGKYQKEWARKRRRLLLEVLGETCAWAYKGGCEGPIQVDCIVPTGDMHHKMDASARQSYYHSQLRVNNLQLLCEKHNGQKAEQDKQHHLRQSGVVFPTEPDTQEPVDKELKPPKDNEPF